ncbi:hypothetical protein Q73A0000_07025 [Kaistella flava (ex Peng et al. 2021)]|uniref:Uncharacterized protein n=1 Tax=Kaistella flava (ex Peng et al. 2021) TaxID=2038776 RepID=A0A7M2Y8G3_9FLAO|nr:hypothetical protein [Kaistella flava (ex Peng et al. 2021)]QOW10129.1 hypothetical protein Q73A0000_07025 [Kaistella flava (ex Peng et al. 2021)]
MKKVETKLKNKKLPLCYWNIQKKMSNKNLSDIAMMYSNSDFYQTRGYIVESSRIVISKIIS